MHFLSYLFPHFIIYLKTCVFTFHVYIVLTPSVFGFLFTDAIRSTGRFDDKDFTDKKFRQYCYEYFRHAPERLKAQLEIQRRNAEDSEWSDQDY